MNNAIYKMLLKNSQKRAAALKESVQINVEENNFGDTYPNTNLYNHKLNENLQHILPIKG